MFGEDHKHPGIPKSVIELHLFRWACLLRIIGGPERPEEVIEALAPHWPQLSEQIPLEMPRIVSSLSWILNTEKGKKKQKIMKLFETCWNKEKLREFKRLLQSEQPYWLPLYSTHTGM